jgi:hypothetical protein
MQKCKDMPTLGTHSCSLPTIHMTDNDQTINVRTHIATAKQNKKRFPTSNQTILIFFSSYLDIAFDNQKSYNKYNWFRIHVLDLANHVESSPVKTSFCVNSCLYFLISKHLRFFYKKKKISMIEQVIFHFKI